MIKKTRIENINKINIGNLDINSLPNKFDNRKVLLTGIPGIVTGYLNSHRNKIGQHFSSLSVPQ